MSGSGVTSDITATWWEDGERFFAAALAKVSDDDLDELSLLAGWPRRTVVAHVARNADALGNLLAWARTGEETPMYASPEARDAGIAAAAELPASQLRTDFVTAAERLHGAMLSLPDEAWSEEVRTAQGRAVPASEVRWMRCREVWVHAVDLDAGVGFADIPDDVLVALIDDVIQTWERRGQMPDVKLISGSRGWGNGPTAVSGDLSHLAACLTGRGDRSALAVSGGFPELPPWI